MVTNGSITPEARAFIARLPKKVREFIASCIGFGFSVKHVAEHEYVAKSGDKKGQTLTAKEKLEIVPADNFGAWISGGRGFVVTVQGETANGTGITAADLNF